MILFCQKLVREKWLWTLCLAILVHVGFFFVFYLNIDKDKSTAVPHERANIDKSSISADVNQNAASSTAKTYTVTDAKKTARSNDDVTQPAMNHESISASNPSNFNSNEVLVAQTLTESTEGASTTSALTLNERAQRSEKLNTQADDLSVAVPSSSNLSNSNSSNNDPSSNTSLTKTETPEEIKARAGLLSMDVPTQQPDSKNIKIDTGYLSAKSDVEDVNSQLSAAINEVKKRNQQKIDETQQLRNSANSEDVTVMSD